MAMTKDTDMTDKSELLAIASYMTDAECAQAYRELKAKADKAGFAIVGEWIDALAAQPRDDMRDAFKAGWRTNAVGEDVQPASYLDGCEQTDWEEYQRVGIDAYCTALATTTQPDTQGTDRGLAMKVPEGQTPLDANLGHRYLAVFNEGVKAREDGTGSPYHGHSLEHCLHAAGWVQRDLRFALDEAKAALRNQPSVDDVIEQCAKVAEDLGQQGISDSDNPLGCECNRIAGIAAHKIADAIRARKGGGA